MIAETISDTGWTVEYILSMPARRFFVLRREFALIEKEQKYSNLLEQCDIAWIPNSTPEYLQQLKEYYRAGLDVGPIKKNVNLRTFDADNDNERAAAAKILEATFKQQAKLMGLG